MAYDSLKAFLDEAPRWLQQFFAAASAWRNVDWEKGYDDENGPTAEDGRSRAPAMQQAEVFGSCVDKDTLLAEDVEHGIALDIDHEAILIPSSTPGHYHLVVHHTAPWKSLKKFLEAAAEVGLISESYAKLSIERQETMLRAPWVRKGQEKEGAQRALAEYLLDDTVSRRVDKLMGRKVLVPEPF